MIATIMKKIKIENCFELLGCKIDDDLENIRRKFYYHFLYFRFQISNIHNYYKKIGWGGEKYKKEMMWEEQESFLYE